MDFSKIFKFKSKSKSKNKSTEEKELSGEDIVNQIINSSNISDLMKDESLDANDESSLTDDEIKNNKKSKISLPKNLDLKALKNNKKLFIIGGAVVGLIVLLMIGTLIFTLVNKSDQAPQVKTEEQIAKEKVYSSIKKDLKIGQSKDSIITKLSIPSEKVGKNYAIDPNYTRIGNNDFLTTYIFSENTLVAILHERILDGTQKHKLSIEFQKFTDDIGQFYPLIEVKKEWFMPELEYDANSWNEAITNNQLELYSDFENAETKEYVKVIASGINYFNFLANDRESLSIGNLNLIYTSSDYKDKFMSFVSLATE